MDKRFEEILKRLKKEYGGEKSALVYKNPYELLVATILAAQCTDVRVNIVTKKLFSDFPNANALSKAEIPVIEEYIKSCGLYKNKAKNLKLCAQRLAEVYGGEVPTEMEDLTSLAGVGRKTANVVRAFAFNIPSMPVDTHVGRLARRLGFSKSKNPDVVEKDICGIIPKEDWCEAHHWLIWHGRRVCKSQNPLCDKCILADICSGRDIK